MKKIDILQLLVRAELLSKIQADAVQNFAAAKKIDVYDAIRATQSIPDDVLGQLIADQYQTPYINLKKRTIVDETLRLIPEVVARSQMVIPFRQDDQFISIALADPQRTDVIASIEKITKKEAHIFYATPENIRDTLGLYRTKLQADLNQELKHAKSDSERIVNLLNTVIQYAFANRASDIHVEPQETDVMLRFRIDGQLHDVAHFSNELHDEIVSRVKVLAKLRTDEHRSAQDGKFQYTYENESADIRVSVVPITAGEKIVMRILSEQSHNFSLEELGLSEKHYEIIIQNSKRPYGMILATGPTGSGKTSTLYSVVKKLNTRSVNISTIEDPVEYDIDGVNQIQVNPKTNLTFAQGLKAILRQDPDIVMVGEIRDKETASIAINAAMTGHLVLSTLHTNDAATTLPRLLDMGIEPFQIASTVNLIIAQRLVRKLHTSYMESYLASSKEAERLLAALTPQERKELKVTPSRMRLFKPKKMLPEHETGYEGRIGIFEIFQITEEMKALIMKQSSADEIRKAGRRLAMHSMYFDGLKKALEGQTSIEEVIKATQS